MEKQMSFATVPIEQAAPYAAADAEVVLRLMDLLKEQLVQEKLEDLFENLERGTWF